MLEGSLENPIGEKLEKPSKLEATPKLLTIDKVFGEGASTVTYVGRNDSIIRTGLKQAGLPLDKVLILACGPYELWSTAGQKALRGKRAEIVGVDRNERITEINRQIQSRGSIAVEEISPLVGSPIFGMDKHRDSGVLLEEAGVGGFHLREGKVRVAKANRDRVRIEEPADVIGFVHTQEHGSYDFIFAGNLENNLLFQKGYTWEAALQFHQDVAKLLRRGGIYAFTTNEVFFNDLTSGSTRNVVEILDQSGLDILYKATQLAHVFSKVDMRFISENCGLVTARKGDFESFPDNQTVIKAVRKRFKEYSPDVDVAEGKGTIEKFRSAITQNETNLVLIKAGQNRYYWFNTPGNYQESFTKLASRSDGFYPELFTAIN